MHAKATVDGITIAETGNISIAGVDEEYTLTSALV